MPVTGKTPAARRSEPLQYVINVFKAMERLKKERELTYEITIECSNEQESDVQKISYKVYYRNAVIASVFEPDIIDQVIESLKTNLSNYD